MEYAENIPLEQVERRGLNVGACKKGSDMRLTECLNDTTIGHRVLAFAVDPGRLVRTAKTETQLVSETGKTYLPGIQQLFDDGVNISPSCAALLIADIAVGRFDVLAGRLLRGVDGSIGCW